MGELTVGTLIKGGFSKGFKNFLPLAVNMILWILTIWIPYLNVGTTIGLAAIAIKMSKGSMISAVEIFNPIYRKRMGEYFLTLTFLYSGVVLGLIFLIIPGIVLLIGWSLATLLVVGKELNPLEAMNESNKLTYGKKWKIFWANLVLVIIVVVAVGIFGLLASKAHGVGSVILYIITAILSLISSSILTGTQATLYEKLVEG